MRNQSVDREFEAIFANARKAGMEALRAAQPTHMYVVEADGLSDRPKPGAPIYREDEGACGFAWVHFKGTTSWGKWTAKKGYSRPDYPSGAMIWISEGGQSIERKTAYAVAFARVLVAHGIEASARSRLD